MSFQNKNLFALLGNDVDEPQASTGPVKEVTRNTGSSKKADVPPASADPAKAKKNNKKPTGNEGALKSKNNNKSTSGPSTTSSSRPKKSFDRHSKTGKTDSAKKYRQGWNNNDEDRALDEESAASEDAKAELEADAASKPQAKSLADYFAEQAGSANQFAAKATRTANQGAEDKWSNDETIEKQQESYISASSSKKVKSKQLKEKKFLDFEATFADESKPAFNNNRKAFKGKGGASNKRAPAPKKPTVNDANFPSL